MWEVVGRQSAVACYSKCQRNWLRGKAYLSFPGKIDKQTEEESQGNALGPKRSQGNAMGPKLVRLFSGHCFPLGGVLTHRAVTQPPGLLSLMNFEFRRYAPAGPSQRWGWARALPRHFRVKGKLRKKRHNCLL